MNYRTLGRTGLQVGEIGLGTEHVVREDWYGCFLEGESLCVCPFAGI